MTDAKDNLGVFHALVYDWNDQKRDTYARSACGIWAWDQEDDETITSKMDEVNCPKCLRATLTDAEWFDYVGEGHARR